MAAAVAVSPPVAFTLENSAAQKQMKMTAPIAQRKLPRAAQTSATFAAPSVAVRDAPRPDFFGDHRQHQNNVTNMIRSSTAPTEAEKSDAFSPLPLHSFSQDLVLRASALVPSGAQSSAPSFSPSKPQQLEGQWVHTRSASGAEQGRADVAGDVDELWLEIREEARRDADAEPALASYLYSTVLAHRSLESALAAHLANKLASPTLLSSHLVSLFRDVLLFTPGVSAAVRRDILAARRRDPACGSYLHCLLNFKGFSALQTHRVAHELWRSGRHSLAFALQSRASEVFHVDIHPAAKFGSGVLLDHATGIVVGETAEVGDDVSMLHGVTLGGTGVSGGTRHPKIGSGVVIGTGVRVLGSVLVGKGAKIGAGSLVLEDVPEGVTVVGSPAKEVKRKVPFGSMFVLDYMI